MDDFCRQIWNIDKKNTGAQLHSITFRQSSVEKIGLTITQAFPLKFFGKTQASNFLCDS